MLRVWITRTQPGADRQAETLRQHGFDVLVAPLLRIERTEQTEPAGQFKQVFFLSEHSVRQGGTLDYCAQAAVFAVGPSTAAILAQRGVVARTPQQASSEGLLALVADAAGADEAQSVLIVAGEGGRKTLRDGLSKAGAEITEWLCYRRIPAQLVTTGMTFSELISAELNNVDRVLVASQDGFRHLARLWFDGGGSSRIGIIAASERIARLGAELGFENVRSAAGAATEDWIAALDESNH